MVGITGVQKCQKELAVTEVGVALT